MRSAGKGIIMARLGEQPMDTEERTAPPDGQTPMPTPTGVWTAKVEKLLRDWHQRVYAAQSAHYASADFFRRLNYLVGIPTMAFSSIVGTALFIGLEKDSPRRWLVAGTSICAAVLAALQTFLRFGEQATLHARAADWYSAIRRDIEEVLVLSLTDRGTPKECLDRIRKEMNRAAQDSPELSGDKWKEEARRFGVLEEFGTDKDYPASGRIERRAETSR